MTPEFSRPERIDTIGTRERTVAIAATEAERAALARRFALVGIDRLEARFAIRQEGRGIVADGRVTGDVVQACSVTGEPLAVAIDTVARLLFVAAFDETGDAELDEQAMDVVEIEHGAIDLGEAAAETMALALDPFPRGPDAADALRQAGVIAEDEVELGPFAGLKAKLEGRRDPL